jgi:hypothetical protein
MPYLDFELRIPTEDDCCISIDAFRSVAHPFTSHEFGILKSETPSTTITRNCLQIFRKFLMVRALLGQSFSQTSKSARLSQYITGHMQAACIEGANHIVVKK